MKHRIATIALLCLACIGTANAQFNETNNLIYHSFRMPYSNQLNPAFFPTNSTVYLTLPSFGVSFGSPLSIKNFVHLDTTSSGDVNTVIDINRMLDAMNANNEFRFGTSFNILGFGFKVRNMFFNAGVTMHNNINVGLPISTINAFRYGNVDADGNPISEVTLVDGDIINFTNYVEASLGGGYKFDEIPLTIGAHAKMLFGVANLQTDNTRAVLRTDENYERIGVDVYYEVQSASAIGVDTNGNAHFTLGNTGVAFDLGARYDYGPFSFSASINDLSAGIHWRRNVNTVVPDGGHTVIEFDGQDVTSIVSGGDMNIDSLTAYYQSLLNGLAPYHNTEDDYWYSIPTKINLGANYSFAKFFRAGILLHGQWDRGLLCKTNHYDFDLTDGIRNTFRFNTTLSFGVNLFNWVELLLGSSVVYDGQRMDFFNPGVGLVLTPATMVQVHIMADYVSSIWLTEAKAFNVKFGLSMLFGRGGKTTILQD